MRKLFNWPEHISVNIQLKSVKLKSFPQNQKYFTHETFPPQTKSNMWYNVSSFYLIWYNVIDVSPLYLVLTTNIVTQVYQQLYTNVSSLYLIWYNVIDALTTNTVTQVYHQTKHLANLITSTSLFSTLITLYGKICSDKNFSYSQFLT